MNSISPETPPSKKLPLNLVMGLLTPLALLFITGLATVPVVIAYGLDVDNLSKALVALLAVTMVGEIITLAALTGIVKKPLGWRSFLGLENFTWKGVGAGAVLGFGFFILLQAASIMAGAFGAEVGNSETSDTLGTSAGLSKFFILALAVPILVPILEELLFRGFCLMAIITGGGGDASDLRSRATIAGIVISSAFFAGLHFQGLGSATDVVVLAVTFTLGVGHAILRLKFKSITPAIASHMTYNGITALLISLA